MTCAGSVSLVAFWISGSWTRMKALCFCPSATNHHDCRGHTFSSPMVNFPVVTLFASAKACSFCIASFFTTVAANLTLDLVYSCPGYTVSSSLRPRLGMTYVDDGVIRQRRKPHIQRLVHLRRIPLEELSTPCPVRSGQHTVKRATYR